jgi:hypothetical protein
LNLITHFVLPYNDRARAHRAEQKAAALQAELIDLL